MKIKSYNKAGEEIKTSEIVLLNENVYRIIKKYINKPTIVDVRAINKKLVGV